MTVYEQCPTDTQAQMLKVMKKHHKELVKAAALVLCIFADAGMDAEDKPKRAVKLHGVPCAATVRLKSAEDRVIGSPDAIIKIDKHIWADLPDIQRAALLDHELTHLVVEYDEHDEVAKDAANRPKLSMRLHDFEIGVFTEVVERYGQDALDAQNVQRLMESELGQQVFAFMEPDRKIA